MKLGSLLAVLIGVLLVVVTEAQCPPGATCPAPTQGWRPRTIASAPIRQMANPAIVRVGCQYGQTTDYGTGTIIRRQNNLAYVLTCWHTFRDAGFAGKPFVVTQRKTYWAKLLRIDKVADLALLSIRDPGVTSISVATVDGKPGEQVQTGGYGNGQYQFTYGRVRTINSDGVLIIAGRNRPGDSGGPVLTMRGQLCGVAWGSNRQICTATCLGPIRRFLRAALPPYFPRPRQVIVMSDKPPPAPPISSTPPVVPVNTAMLERIADLERELQSLRAQVKACTGQPGPPGKDGVAGPQGKAGRDANIDVGQVAEEVKRRIQGSIRVEVRPITKSTK